MIKIREIEEFVKYQKHLNKSSSTIISYKKILPFLLSGLIKKIATPSQYIKLRQPIFDSISNI